MHEEEAAAPAPAAPAAAPPADISLGTLIQELHADSRVQYDSKISTQDDVFAKAAIQLADAFAKGDSKALKPMLTRRAGELLTDMESNGDWTNGTKTIEAVRIVAIGTPPASMNIAVTQDQELASMLAQWDTLLDKEVQKLEGDPKLDSDPAKKAELEGLKVFRQRVTRELPSGGKNLTPNDKDEIRKLMKGWGFVAQQQQVGGKAADMGVILAIQDPGGSYILGWTANKGDEGYMFDMASTLAEPRRRASDWDGVGMGGFSLNRTVERSGAPIIAPTPGKGKEPDAGGGGASVPTGTTPGTPPPPKPADPAGPVKRTPGGPVTIPGPGGGG